MVANNGHRATAMLVTNTRAHKRTYYNPNALLLCKLT